ncbi:MAG: sulfurtransferase complex subunit TusB [Gammaproteobacteria bacterium]|nr:sulfurtransferase complex subunit TusB [Gammaproteobacteria bacterium]
MSTLHTVNKSPFERNSLDTCLTVAATDSTVLMYEDGVAGALQNTSASSAISDAMGQGVKFAVLGEDLDARGLSSDRVMDGISVVDYAGFVQLAADHDNVQSWL